MTMQSSPRKSPAKQRDSPGMICPKVITPITAPLSPGSQTSSSSSSVDYPSVPRSALGSSQPILSSCEPARTNNMNNSYRHPKEQRKSKRHQEEVADLLQILEAAGSVTSFDFPTLFSDEDDGDFESCSKTALGKSSRHGEGGRGQNDMVTLNNLYRLSKSMASLRSEETFDMDSPNDSWWQESNRSCEMNTKSKKSEDFLKLMMSQQELEDQTLTTENTSSSLSGADDTIVMDLPRRCPGSVYQGGVAPCRNEQSRFLEKGWRSCSLQLSDRLVVVEKPKIQSSTSQPMTPRRKLECNSATMTACPKTCTGVSRRRSNDFADYKRGPSSHSPTGKLLRRLSFSETTSQHQPKKGEKGSKYHVVTDHDTLEVGCTPRHDNTVSSFAIPHCNKLCRNKPSGRLSRPSPNETSVPRHSPSAGDGNRSRSTSAHSPTKHANRQIRESQIVSQDQRHHCSTNLDGSLISNEIGTLQRRHSCSRHHEESTSKANNTSTTAKYQSPGADQRRVGRVRRSFSLSTAQPTEIEWRPPYMQRRSSLDHSHSSGKQVMESKSSRRRRIGSFSHVDRPGQTKTRSATPETADILKETGLTAEQMQKLVDAGYKVVLAD